MSAKAFPNRSLPAARLKILIVCEDLECGKSAKELQDQLLLALGARVEFVPDVWTFRALQHPELQDLAENQIDQADLILFSTRGDADVPTPIRQWLETRLAEPKRQRALVLLFSPAATPNQIKATHLYLETIAHRGGLQLFVGQQQVAEQGERAYIQPEIPMGK